MLNYQGTLNTIPMCSMYGIFTNIYLINDPNVVNIPYMEHMGIDYPHAFLQGFAGAWMPAPERP